ncbi:transposase-like protein [Rhodanobacter sp. ANJX3]|uniref:transposase n=1 Tax=unclassified Rhodanobacter TaxID=2621553 RepID=UPI0015C6C6C8|nr:MULTISPECIES: transposase [unclassified Rhodanobacter]MBB5357015.1 transposase-like protein [Rhodanobacter sp. ANJX3]NYE27088.1 transposase-like protein [Rhodanobacter sp. K2T2]
MAMTVVFMSSNKHYTDEFRAEAVRHVIERGFTVVDVATRIEIPKHTLYGLAQAAKKGNDQCRLGSVIAGRGDYLNTAR